MNRKRFSLRFNLIAVIYNFDPQGSEANYNDNLVKQEVSINFNPKLTALNS